MLLYASHVITTKRPEASRFKDEWLPKVATEDGVEGPWDRPSLALLKDYPYDMIIQTPIW